MTGCPDYLVSFCLVYEENLAAEVETLKALDCVCAKRLQYWEIIYVVGESEHAAIRKLANTFAGVKNLRILLVRDGTSYYKRRAIGAAEAIGDAVVLTAFNEMKGADVIAFAEQAVKSNQIVMARSKQRWRGVSLSHWIVGALSRYRVDARDLKTIALPRERLTAVLARTTASIDLRFEPKTGYDPYIRRRVELTKTGGEATYKQRLELLLEIVTTSAPRFLAAYASMSLLVSLLALSYGVYAVIVILTHTGVQPGWFSAALAQSGSVAFLSIGLAVIALGIASLLERIEGGARDVIVDEIGNISFYDHVYEINVEINNEVEKVAA